MQQDLVRVPALLQPGLSHLVGPWTLAQKWLTFFHVLVSRIVAVLNFVGCEYKNTPKRIPLPCIALDEEGACD